MSSKSTDRAPQWLTDKITKELIGKVKYVDELPNKPMDDPTIGFGCWGFVRYLFRVTGDDLPENVYRAQALCVQTDKPEYRCVASWKSQFAGGRVHLGFLENNHTVVHCSVTTNGVARTDMSIFVKPPVLWKLKC